MARAGDELVDPITGERMIFRKTAKETDGELLQLDRIGKAGWKAGPLHVHPYQEERFEVISGTLGSHVAGASASTRRAKWSRLRQAQYIRCGTPAVRRKCTPRWSSVRRCARRQSSKP
jgi:hypothetical protein